MFGLTFAIYGAMTMISILVFAIEVMVGKRTKIKDKPPGNKEMVATLEGQVAEDNLKGDKNEVLTLEEQVEDKDGQDDMDQKEDLNEMATVQVYRGNDNLKDDEVKEDKDKEDQIEIIEIS